METRAKRRAGPVRSLWRLVVLPVAIIAVPLSCATLRAAPPMRLQAPTLGGQVAALPAAGAVRVRAELLWKLRGSQGVGPVVFTPDSKTIVSGTSSGWSRTGPRDLPEVRFWDLETGRTKRILKIPGNSVSALAFGRDGKTFTTLGIEDRRGNLVHLVTHWNATGKMERERTVQGANEFALSPDGKAVAGVAWLWPRNRKWGKPSGDLRLWDTQTGKLTTGTPRSGAAMQEGLHFSGTSVAYSRDGKVFAFSTWDGTVRLWDVKTRGLKQTLLTPENVEPNRQNFQVDPRELHALIFSPDGRILVGGGYLTRCWDLRTGRMMLFARREREGVHCLALSPNGELLAGGGIEAVQLWEAATGSLLAALPAHLVSSVAFSPDGKLLASGMHNAVVVWRINRG